MKYNISPYDPNFTFQSSSDQSHLENYLNGRFRRWCYTLKAREAIKIALGYYNLAKDDVVTILTTSGNFYISSCVTNAIESVCRWSREILPETKVLFVNHEFGYPYKDLEGLKGYGLPIIEDCAYAFFSESKGYTIGKIGDFAIYSLPKAFPVEWGGILVFNNPDFDLSHPLDENEHSEWVSNLSSVIADEGMIKAQRLWNYRFLRDQLEPLGIEPFFELEDGVIPGVFLFNWLTEIDYADLKIYMQDNGVECSVFYGRNAFFIPMHHLLTEGDLLFFCRLLKKYIIENEIFKH